MGKYSYKNALIILKEWALKEGFINISFDYNEISQIDWIKSTLNTPNSIKIEGNLSYELQTYIFLHELGHHQLRKDWNEFHKILPTLIWKKNIKPGKKD
jgi:Zn-dependent peptidase ImmA (M78 family)